jgi:hypothetical protein
VRRFDAPLTVRSTRTATGGASRLGGRRLPWFVTGITPRNLPTSFGSPWGKAIPYGDGKAGHIEVGTRSSESDELSDYRLRLNAAHEPNVQFATLTHELGHLYLGHLGRTGISRLLTTEPNQGAARGGSGICFSHRLPAQ